jgi:hypothetical protein
LSADGVSNLGSILSYRSLFAISQVITHAPERMCNGFESRCGGLTLLVHARGRLVFRLVNHVTCGLFGLICGLLRGVDNPASYG